MYLLVVCVEGGFSQIQSHILHVYGIKCLDCKLLQVSNILDPNRNGDEERVRKVRNVYMHTYIVYKMCVPIM